MDLKKLSFAIVLIFLLIETTVAIRQKRKDDKESQGIQVRNDGLSVNLASTSNDNNVKATDNSMIIASPHTSNLTDTTLNQKVRAKKTRRPKQRRAHHRRKHHNKCSTENKRQNQTDNGDPNHELATASLTSSRQTRSDVPKQGSIDKRGRTHHQKKSCHDESKQPQRRRSHARARAHKKNSKRLGRKKQQSVSQESQVAPP